MEKALKMGESNACMKRIVAAPTAGSCGVIPAVLLSYEKCFNVTEEECVKALLIAAGIGAVIAEKHLLQERQEAVRQRLVQQVQWQLLDLHICREQIAKAVPMRLHLR